MVWRCQMGLAPTYLTDLCRPVSGTRSSRSLSSSQRGLLSIQFARTTIIRAALVLWCVRRSVMASLLRYAYYDTVSFDSAGVGSTSEWFSEKALYKSLNEWMKSLNECHIYSFLNLGNSNFALCVNFLECEEGTYGPGCKLRCDCKNGATCDHIDGVCSCGLGWHGELCDRPCSSGSFGRGCEEVCNCENGARCDHVTGECFCAPGWKGFNCMNPCNQGNWGRGCNEVRSANDQEC